MSSQLSGIERAVKHNHGLALRLPIAQSTGPHVAHPEHTFPFLNLVSMPQDTPGRKPEASLGTRYIHTNTISFEAIGVPATIE